MPSSQSSSPSAAQQANKLAEALMDDFAWFLYKEAPDVFQNVHRIKRLLNLADRRFRDDDDRMQSFFNPCTQDIEGDCWAFSCHHRFNTVLIPHGVEMIAISQSAFALQTLENAEYSLFGPGDLFVMCVCIWLLRTHCCISKVVINVATVARFCAPLFWRLLSLNAGHLDKVQLIGLPADQSDFRVSQVFENATELSEIAIAHIALSDNQIELLCSVIEQNEGLKRLVLKCVSMTTIALQVLSRAIAKHSRPTSFELREKTPAREGYETAMAGLLDAPVSTLCLEAPCDWAELLKRLRYNTCLSDLEIFDCGSHMCTSLKDLADVLLENSTLRRLKLCVSFPRMGDCATDQWLKLTQLIGRNQGLKSPSLASSKFCKDCVAMVELAEAIARNKCLVELSVEECDLSLASLFFVLFGLSHNETMETLRIGILLMDEEVNRLVLERIAELGLGERVDCVYAVKSDWPLVRSREAYGMTCFRKVRVLYSPALDGDHSLNIVHRMQETLTSLYLEGMAGVYMSCTAAQCLADVFAESNALEHVTLLLDVDAGIVVTVLEGLALSRTIYSVVVGHRWQLCGKVAIAFGETLQKNSSIAELTVWQDTRIGFEELKAQLRLGVKRNYAIYKVQLLYGPEKNESHDWALLQMLQNNRIAINWAADIILGNSCTGACMYAFIRMKACNNCWAVLRHATGCDKQELESKMAEACKRSERGLLRVPPGVAQAGGQIEVSGKRTSDLCTLDNDFIEQVKIFFEAKKRENKPRRAQQT